MNWRGIWSIIHEVTKIETHFQRVTNCKRHQQHKNKRGEMDIGKRKTFTSSSLHYNNPPKIQFLSSISDLGFNMFWEWWREEGFRVQLMVNNGEKGLISSRRRVNFVGEGLMSSEKTACSLKKKTSSSWKMEKTVS
jgi:hypothetical protein